MLSEAERRKLTEIETQLGAEDPAFVERFANRAKPRLRSRWRGVVALLVVAVAMMVAGYGLIVASIGTVVVALIGIGASAGLWVTHRLGP
jgi:hypothetical protein